ncbi:restriction endonuclease [Lactococcus sp.]|uniref:restriction endonuclease n=1 Tax=Lactococcus sp. TaxID=44273 RepID=UPI0035B4C2FB
MVIKDERFDKILKRYTLREFENLKQFDAINSESREGIVATEIMQYLTNTSGKASKKEFLQYLIEMDDIIPSEYVTKDFISKTGKPYKKFEFNYSFGRRNLITAGFIKDNRGMLELTEKGHSVDMLNFDYVRDVVSISQEYWKKKAVENKELKSENDRAEEETEEIIIQNEINTEQWREDLKSALLKMSPKKFERFSRLLVKNMGVEIDPEKGVQISNDGGIDGFGYMRADDFRTNRIGIQAKRWQGNVGGVEIRNFIGSLSTNLNQAEYGIFVATSYFNKNAIETAKSSKIPITLINIDDICDLVAKYEIFVKPVTIYELDDFYFNE